MSNTCKGLFLINYQRIADKPLSSKTMVNEEKRVMEVPGGSVQARRKGVN